MTPDSGESPVDEWPGERFLCACFTDALHVMRSDDGDVEFAIWQYGGWPTPWRQRFRYIWRVLRRGDPWGDQVVLPKHEVERLARLLSTITGQTVTWTTSTGTWTPRFEAKGPNSATA